MPKSLPNLFPKDYPDRQSADIFYSSLVTEHIVPKENELIFKQWQGELVELAQGYAGFLRCDLSEPLPCRDRVIKCYNIIHFDSPIHLSKWIESSDRQRLLASGQDVFSAYRFKSFTTGLEGWFSLQFGNSEYAGLGPPRWKQILAVVLGLYPIVMLQSFLFTKLGIMQSWSLANSMLVNNLVTSTILSIVVMPVIAQKLRFWLKPAYLPTSVKTNLIGGAIVLGLLINLMIGFNIASFFWF